MRPLANRMGRLGTETAFEVLARARALEAKGRHIVHLEIGEPDFDTPKSVTAAGVAAIERGETHYTPSAGVIELREAIAQYLSRARGVSIDASQVIVAPGAKPIMFYAILALIDHGDEAIFPDPGFPIYASMINFAGGTPISLPLREENDFVPDVDELRRLVTPKTKLIILNSPHNPTGGLLSKEAVREIAKIARENDIWVLSDEIYAELIYEGTHHSIAREEGMAERTIILDGFSKTFAAPARGRPDDRGLPQAPRRDRRRAQQDRRHHLPYAERRVLCLPEHHRARARRRKDSRRPRAAGGRGGVPRRHGLRRDR